jgi:hypothetical protein
MAETKKNADTPAYGAVSLPARGFEMGELQDALSKGLGAAKDEAGVDRAARAAVIDALPEGQVALDYDPGIMPGYEAVKLAPEGDMDFQRTTLIYVPDDAKPAAVKVIEAAQDDGKALASTGKAVELPADAGTTKGN